MGAVRRRFAIIDLGDDWDRIEEHVRIPVTIDIPYLPLHKRLFREEEITESGGPMHSPVKNPSGFLTQWNWPVGPLCHCQQVLWRTFAPVFRWDNGR